MRFAMQRGRWNLTPEQCYLRDALFNLGCYGVNDPSEEYSAEAYEDRQNLPLWCWQFELFEQFEHGMTTDFDGIGTNGKSGQLGSAAVGTV